MNEKQPQCVPENAPGDFYVEANLCTSCCLVHGEAPELMNDRKKPFRECFFRRQPETPAEIDHVINAICVSEMTALRYGGTDQKIIRKLEERGCAAQCDFSQKLLLAPVAQSSRGLQWKNHTIDVRAHLVPRFFWMTASIDVYIDGNCVVKTGGQFKVTGSSHGTYNDTDGTHAIELSWGSGAFGELPYVLRIDGVIISEARVKISSSLFIVLFWTFLWVVIIAILSISHRHH